MTVGKSFASDAARKTEVFVAAEISETLIAFAVVAPEKPMSKTTPKTRTENHEPGLRPRQFS